VPGQAPAPAGPPPGAYPPPPASIYAPPPAPRAAAEPAPAGQGVRTYSVHRAFGLQPDQPAPSAPGAGEALALADVPEAEPSKAATNLASEDAAEAQRSSLAALRLRAKRK
jgi:hypothetical protein